MRVGAADTERAHSRADRAIPRYQGLRDDRREQRPLAQRRIRSRLAPAGKRRQRPVMQRHHRLDQPGDPRRDIAMADIRLDRAQRAAPLGAPREHLCQTRQLDRIAQRSPCPMRLDERDARRLHIRDCQRFHDHIGLPRRGRRGEARLGRAVIVDRAAPDHRIDTVAVGQRVRQRLQYHCARTIGEHRAAGRSIERAAAAIGRFDPVRARIAARRRHPHRHAAGQRHVALAQLDAAARQMHRHESRRTGALHRDRRPPQIELERDSRRHEILVVGGVSEEVVGLVPGAQRGRDIVEQIGGKPRAREHADALIGVRGAPGIVQRPPAGFEEYPLLRIEQRRFARCVAEKQMIERVDIGKLSPGLLQVVFT
jgi:hypothetical protein